MAGRRSPGRARAPAIRLTATPRPAGRGQLGAQAPLLPGVDEQFYPVWEAVYRDNIERVYRLMFAKVGNRPDAEDLTADVFLAALGPLRISASTAEVRAYLLVAAALALASLGRLCRVPHDSGLRVRRVRLPACSPGLAQRAGRDRSPGPARCGRC